MNGRCLRCRWASALHSSIAPLRLRHWLLRIGVGQPPLEQVAPPVMQGEPNLEQAGDRATVASSSQAEHICIICRDLLRSESSDEVMALPCAHVFHRQCVQEYAECTGKPVARACPYRCGTATVFEAEGEDPEAVENEAGVDPPAPVRQALTPNMERALEEQLGVVQDLFTS